MSQDLSAENLNKIKLKYVFTDIDDTLTLNGKLLPNAYEALWKLKNAGIKVIPVTGRPAGWCEMIVRFWPVEAVIGENGGFYFYFDDKTLKREFVNSKKERKENQEKLKKIEEEVLKTLPHAAIASDQFTRLMDLAVDHCEDIPPLTDSEVNKIVEIFEKHGAHAKISSIHVNGWFGKYDKVSMIKQYISEQMSETFKEVMEKSIFVGDSPNDAPNFEAFKYSIGVSNIKKYLDQIKTPPTFIAKHEGGDGFVEFVDLIT